LPQQTRPGNWDFVGIGDLNGDEVADAVWREPTTGHVDIWLMSPDRQITDSTGFLFTDTNWRVAGLADVNGDLVTDLLLHNTVTQRYYYWVMLPLVGETLSRSAVNFAEAVWFGEFFSGHPNLDFDLVGAAEFDVDERVFDTSGFQVLGDDIDADLLWRHRITGALEIWSMSLVTYDCAQVPDPVLRAGCRPSPGYMLVYERTKDARSLGERAPFWKVGASADLNADGHTDIVWFAGNGAPPDVHGALEITLLDVNGPGTQETVPLTDAVTGEAVVLNEPGSFDLVGP
jgi:hypothetical protein